MATKALDLYDAYTKSMLPYENGYIVSSFFSHSSAYSRYEVVSYNNIKGIFPSDEGLTFQSDGKKLHILVEPMDYPKKSEEPYVRVKDEQIPHRFNELELHTARNQTKIYWGKNSIMSYTSFTVLKPTGINFALVFFWLPDIYDSLNLFFEKTFNREAGVPLADAKKVAKQVAQKVKDTLTWEFS